MKGIDFMSSMIELDWASEARDEEGVLSDVIDAIGPAARGSRVIKMNGPAGGYPVVKVSYDGEPHELAKRLVDIGYCDPDEAEELYQAIN